MFLGVQTKTAWSPDTTVVATRRQVSCDLSGEAVILHLEQGIYYGLNPVGAFVWNLLQVPRSIDDITSSLLREFEVDSAQCEADLTTLLQALSDNQLIEIHHDRGEEIPCASAR